MEFNGIEPVSIVLPTYNRAHIIKKSIESVLNQTYPYFELLIIDDGSTDNTESVITNEFDDKRIVYYRLPENDGQSKARNYGMNMAKYDYIAFQDSDVIWMPHKLENQMYAILNADDSVGMVYHKVKRILNGNNYIIPNEKIPLDRKKGYIYEQLLWDNFIDMPAILVKKMCVQSVGLLDETLKCLEDYDFALRISQKYNVVFLDEVLLDSEVYASGVSCNLYQYCIASCIILKKYKSDYLTTGTFNHRVENIINVAEQINFKEQIVQFMEKLLSLPD